MTYDLLCERINLFHRTPGHLRALAREEEDHVRKIRLNMVADALAKIADEEIAKVGVK